MKKLLCFFLSTLSQFGWAELEYQHQLVYENLDRPWGMTFVGPQKLLITEKSGQLKLLDLSQPKSLASNVSGLPEDIDSRGQGGLMDIKLAANGWLYFTYSKSSTEGRGATTLARAKLAGQRLKHWQDLLVTQSVSKTGRHYGSRIALAGDGSLYFGVGDRGSRPNAQRLVNHMGTVMRVDMLGQPVPSNPFYHSAAARPEIFSYGHRNPQGLAIDDQGQLWEIEHGPRGGDEINRLLAGKNYGWPVISHGREYSRDEMVGEAKAKVGMESPSKFYIPSIAPSSLMIYSGRAFPQWRGQFFAGALVLTHLNRLALDEQGKLVEQERMFDDLGERVRHVVEGPQGNIYLLTDSGKLIKVSPPA